MGSPPHTWRIHQFVIDHNGAVRITSTYVENTRNAKEAKLLDEDHLHIRGEYLVLPAGVLVGVGSPPHTWRIRITS